MVYARNYLLLICEISNWLINCCRSYGKLPWAARSHRFCREPTQRRRVYAEEGAWALEYSCWWQACPLAGALQLVEWRFLSSLFWGREDDCSFPLGSSNVIATISMSRYPSEISFSSPIGGKVASAWARERCTATASPLWQTPKVWRISQQARYQKLGSKDSTECTLGSYQAVDHRVADFAYEGFRFQRAIAKLFVPKFRPKRQRWRRCAWSSLWRRTCPWSLQARFHLVLSLRTSCR